jgi:parvulin-like peptidyl-prolyl isomerase
MRKTTKAIEKPVAKKIIRAKKVDVAPVVESRRRFSFARPLVVLIALVVLALLLVQNKGLILAATVNNQPVWRWDLEKRLSSQYGAQMLDELTSEALIYQAAAKQGITVKNTEVDAKLAEKEKTLNGKMTLSDALAAQGTTVEEYRRWLGLEMLLEKLVANQVSVSDQEVNDYLEKNKGLLTATEEGAMKEEARQAVLSDKQNAAIRQYFTDLRGKAKISKFL